MQSTKWNCKFANRAQVQMQKRNANSKMGKILIAFSIFVNVGQSRKVKVSQSQTLPHHLIEENKREKALQVLAEIKAELKRKD